MSDFLTENRHGRVDDPLSFVPVAQRADYEKLATLDPDPQLAPRKIAISHFFAKEYKCSPIQAYSAFDVFAQKFTGEEKPDVNSLYDRIAPLHAAPTQPPEHRPQAELRPASPEARRALDRAELEKSTPASEFRAAEATMKRGEWLSNLYESERIQLRQLVGNLWNRTAEALNMQATADALGGFGFSNENKEAVAGMFAEGRKEQHAEAMKQNQALNREMQQLVKEANRDVESDAMKFLNELSIRMIPSLFNFTVAAWATGGTAAPVMLTGNSAGYEYEAAIREANPGLSEADYYAFRAGAEVLSEVTQFALLAAGKLFRPKVQTAKTMVGIDNGEVVGAARQIGNGKVVVGAVAPEALKQGAWEIVQLGGGKAVATQISVTVDRSVPAVLKYLVGSGVSGTAISAFSRFLKNSLEISLGVRPEDKRFEGVAIEGAQGGVFNAFFAAKDLWQMRKMPGMRQTIRAAAETEWNKGTPETHYRARIETQRSAGETLAKAYGNGGQPPAAPTNGGAGTLTRTQVADVGPGGAGVVTPGEATVGAYDVALSRMVIDAGNGYAAAREMLPRRMLEEMAAKGTTTGAGGTLTRKQATDGGAGVATRTDTDEHGSTLTNAEQVAPEQTPENTEVREVPPETTPEMKNAPRDIAEIEAAQAEDLQEFHNHVPHDVGKTEAALAVCHERCPGIPVKTYRGWPEEIAEKIRERGQNPDHVPCYYDKATGTAYFNVGAFGASRADELFTHEVAMHGGLDRLLGDKAPAFYDAVARDFRSDPDFVRIAKAYFPGASVDQLTPEQLREVGEEYTRLKGEEGMKPEAERSPWYSRFISWLKRVFSKLGFRHLTDRDVKNTALAAARYATRVKAAKRGAPSGETRFATGNGTNGTNGTRMRPYYDVPFAESVDAVINGTAHSGGLIFVTKTPEAFKAIGIPGFPFMITRQHIKDIYNLTAADGRNAHGLGEQLKRLPDMLDKPVAIIAEPDEQAGRSKNRVVAITQYRDKHGNDIMIPVIIGATTSADGTMRITANIAATSYGKQSAPQMLQNAIDAEKRGEVAIFGANKKITSKLPMPGTPIVPGGGFNVVHNIDAQGSPVKGIFAKSQTESLQFGRFFENSQIVDANGKPLEVFHGSDYDPLEQPDGRGTLKPHTMFTADREYAGRYGKHVHGYYLSIKHPFDIRNPEDYKILKEYRNGHDPSPTNSGAMDWADYGYDDFVEYLNEKYPGKYDGAILDEGADGGYGAPVKSRGLSYVIFYEGQAKSSKHNIGTFDPNNPDVRFAIDDGEKNYVEPVPFDPDGRPDLGSVEGRAVAVLKPRYGSAAEFDDAEVAAYLNDHGFDGIDEREAHRLAAIARNAYQTERIRESNRKANQRRDDWIYDNVRLYKHAVDFGGKGFKIRFPKDYAHKDDSGTFLAKKGESGIDLIELAKYIARVEGRPNEEKEIAEELAEFFRDLKKPDLYRKYYDAVRETAEGEREVDRQAKEEYSRYLEEQARDLIEKGAPVTREVLEENPALAKVLYNHILGKAFPGKKWMTGGDIDDINAALMNKSDNPRLVAAISGALRQDLRKEYTEKMRDFRDQLREGRVDAAKLQREAAALVRNFIAPQYRGRYFTQIIKLGTIENEAKRKVAFDALCKHIVEDDKPVYELADETAKLVRDAIYALPRDARAAFLSRMETRNKIGAPEKRITALEELFNEVKAAEEKFDAAALKATETKDKIFEMLPKGHRDKFLARLSALAKIADPEKRVEAFDGMLQEAADAAEAVRKAANLEKFTKRLKQLAPKVNRSRKLIGTRTIEAQEAIAEIAGIVKMSEADVENEIDELNAQIYAALDAGNGEQAAELQARSALLSTYGDLAGKSADEVYRAYDQLERLAVHGRNDLLDQIAERKAKVQKIVDQAVLQITSGKGVAEGEEAKRITNRQRESALSGIKEHAWALGKLEDMLFVMASHGTKVDWLETPLGRLYQRVHMQALAKQVAEMEFFDEREKVLARILGVKHSWQIAAGLQEFKQRRESWGITRLPASSRQIEYQYVTIEQAREMLAAYDLNGSSLAPMQAELLRAKLKDLDNSAKKTRLTSDSDPTTQEVYRAMDKESEEGYEQKMIGIPVVTFDGSPVAWGDNTAMEVLHEYLNFNQPDVRYKMQMNGWVGDSGEQLKKAVPPELLQYADWMLEQFRKQGVRLSEVQKELYYAAFKPLKNYFPTLYDRLVSGIGQLPLDDKTAPRRPEGLQALGSLKERVAHLQEPRAADADAVFLEQWRRSNHYIHFAELARDLLAVVKHPDLKKACDQTYGPEWHRELIQTVNEVINGGSDAKYRESLERIMGVGTRTRMAFNWLSGAKQLGSMFAQMNDMPVGAFWTNFFGAMRDFHDIYPVLIKSAYLSQRFKNGADMWAKMAFDSRNRYVVTERSTGTLGRKLHLDAGKLAAAGQMLNMAAYYGSAVQRAGDSLPVLLGGAAVYRYHYNRMIKQRFTPEEAQAHALLRWEMSVDSLQQSSFFHTRNAWQRGNTLEKAFTRFLSAQILNDQRTGRAIVARLFYGRDDWTLYHSYLDGQLRSGEMRAVSDDEYRRLVDFYKKFPLGESVVNKWGERLVFAPLDPDGTEAYIHHFAVKRQGDGEEYFDGEYLDLFDKLKSSLKDPDERLLNATKEGIPRIVYIKKITTKNGNHVMVVNVAPDGRLLNWTHMDSKDAYIENLRAREREAVVKFGLVDEHGKKLNIGYDEYLRKKADMRAYLAATQGPPGGDPQTEHTGDDSNIPRFGGMSSKFYSGAERESYIKQIVKGYMTSLINNWLVELIAGGIGLLAIKSCSEEDVENMLVKSIVRAAAGTGTSLFPITGAAIRGAADAAVTKGSALSKVGAFANKVFIGDDTSSTIRQFERAFTARDRRVAQEAWIDATLSAGQLIGAFIPALEWMATPASALKQGKRFYRLFDPAPKPRRRSVKLRIPKQFK